MGKEKGTNNPTCPTYFKCFICLSLNQVHLHYSLLLLPVQAENEPLENLSSASWMDYTGDFVFTKAKSNIPMENTAAH